MAVACAALLVVGFAVLMIKLAPEWLASTAGLGPSDASEERGRVRTGLLTLLAGSVAAIGAAYTARSYRLARRGQMTERFGRAIEHLASKSEDIRLGGIFELERIAQESELEHGPVMQVLTAYVREHAPWSRPEPAPEQRTKPEGEDEKDASQSLLGSGALSGERSEADMRLIEAQWRAKPAERTAVEIQAIMTVLSRRKVEYELNHPVRLDLSGTYLVGVKAPGIPLRGANLSGSHLGGIDFSDGDLRGADLSYTLASMPVFDRARLDKADLRFAELVGASFQGTRLDEARLDGAKLLGAQLQGAYLRTAEWDAAFPPDFGISVHDARTKFPVGFDPDAAISFLVDEHGERIIDD